MLIDIERNRRPLTDLVTTKDVLRISSITAAELIFGVYRAESSARRQLRERFVADVFSAFEVLPFDLPAARIHADVRAQLTADGQLIGTHDLIIAATALANDHAVLTTNVGEFRRVPGLRVLEPSW